MGGKRKNLNIYSKGMKFYGDTFIRCFIYNIQIFVIKKNLCFLRNNFFIISDIKFSVCGYMKEYIFHVCVFGIVSDIRKMCDSESYGVQLYTA